ncbi:hypothetical protein ACFWP3_17050 [Streptomyces sp. NPDC058525]|uniref:hypothetical protein n=1 Tax=Streptomyces sp. NPDC058525 TaxID=3346538 RepID=UPI0036652102
MSDTVRIRPIDNEPIGWGANVHDMRERTFQNAIQSYYNKDRLMTPQGMLSAPVANSQTGRGLFDGLEGEAPRRAYSDVV